MRGVRSLRTLLRRSRLLGAVLVALALLLTAIVVVVPLDDLQQGIFAAVGVALLLVFRRSGGRRMTLFLVALSCTVSLRYIYWRINDTLEFDSFLQGLFGLGLVLAELYAVGALVLGYMQTVQPLQRKPVQLPPDPTLWPTVDVYIPTYDETLDVVRPTVLGALAMDWPQDRFNVYILDDGRRPEMRAFAERAGAGYIIRPDNKGAKAGNINHALRLTDGELIAIFDCDHTPTRAFLQMTVGSLVRDGRLAMVQTPHYFYSPDPFERNLAVKRRVPNEGLLFYGLVQPGNDLWNATFFCGSCAVIRRTALEEVGGVPTVTVTEDAHCSLRMQKAGWATAYLRLPLAGGLATDRLALHLGQRMRWARGMLQILRVENPLLTRGLTLPQRLCYFMAAFHFLFALPRIVFLTSPLAYLLLGQNIIAASPLAILAYAGPHVIHSFGTASRLAGRNRHSFWSEIYETTLALRLLPLTVATLINPRAGKFNVTAKGGTLLHDMTDWRSIMPNIILAILLGCGIAVGCHGMMSQASDTLGFQADLLNSAWASLCLIPVLASIAVGRERWQPRKHARIPARLSVTVRLADGSSTIGETRDLSLGGAAIAAARPTGLTNGDRVILDIEVAGESNRIPARVLAWEEMTMRAQFLPETLADESHIVQVVLGRPDAWLGWDDFRTDKPLRALGDVLAATFSSVLRIGRRRYVRAASPGVVVPNRRSEILRPAAAPEPRAARVMVGAICLFLLGATVMRASAVAQTAPGGRPVPVHSGSGLTIRLDPMPATAPADPVAAAGSQDASLDAVPMPTVDDVPATSAPQLAIADTPRSAAPPAAATPSFRSADAAEASPTDTLPVAEQPATPPPSLRHLSLPLHRLGLRGPMQLRGTSDLQGVAFGIRSDEVVTGARLILSGGVSPSLLPSLSQVSVTLNDQPVGTIVPDPARPTFGPLEIAIDPRFFADVNNLNFRFAGHYTLDCNDPLSGLLWATVSDMSTLELTLAHLPPVRDLARLPEPLFDRHALDEMLNLPVTMVSDPSLETLRAAAVATSWFAVQADYRGAAFNVSNQLPLHGNGLVIVSGNEVIDGLPVGRFAGPTLRVLANPNDAQGTLLVVGGRTASEAIAAADALAAAPATLTGASALVEPPQFAARKPYDAPRWLPTDHAIRFGDLVAPRDLQAYGYAPGTIRIPFRTAPDIYTWRNRPFPVDLKLNAPTGPIVDVAASRLDISLGDSFLRSVHLGDAESFSPLSWIMRHAWAEPTYSQAHVGLPPYLIFGQNELDLRFDLRPMSRGACAAVPGDIHASIDPNSTIDISSVHRYTRLPNLSLFASSGFPFTRLADLSGTAAIIPEHASEGEISAFLSLVGQLSANVGLAATGLAVVRPAQMNEVADRDLLVVGVLGHAAALRTVLKDAPVQLEGNRLSMTLPDAIQNVRALFTDAPARTERDRAASQLSQAGEGLGALLGLESPLRAGKSAVVLTGVTPLALNAMLAVLRDPEQQRHVQGDLSLVSGGQVSSFRTGATFPDGDLPFWMWPQQFVGDRAGVLLALLAAAGLFFALPLTWFLRVRSAARLRGRL